MLVLRLPNEDYIDHPWVGEFRSLKNRAVDVVVEYLPSMPCVPNITIVYPAHKRCSCVYYYLPRDGCRFRFLVCENVYSLGAIDDPGVV